MTGSSLRDQLLAELHARPFERVLPPARIVYFALANHGVSKRSEITHLNRLCRDQGRPPITEEGRNHQHLQFAGFTLTWERHAEFTSYAFILPAASAPFAEVALPAEIEKWRQAIKGELVCAARLAFVDRTAPTPDAALLAQVFAGRAVIGSQAVGGQARLWTDLYTDADGFIRILLQDIQLSEQQAGRLTRRLVEIQAYAMMALLALPVARKIGPDIARFEAALSEVVTVQREESSDESALLGQITDLAAHVEHLLATTNYRFGAARAYDEIVQRRIRELREIRIEGLQPLEEFMERRLGPAMRTCETVHARLTDLSQRVARASELLRTRVDVHLSAQTRDLLVSMDRRVRTQLRLQQTVESLSVVAITYYASSVIEHLASGLESLGLAVHAEAVGGLSVPLVAFFAWRWLQRLHRRIHLSEPAAAEFKEKK